MMLVVSRVDHQEGLFTFERSSRLVNPQVAPEAPGNTILTNHIPDGCHGAPIVFQGKCVGILVQPRINQVARTAVSVYRVLPKSYHKKTDDDDAYDPNLMSKMEWEMLQLEEQKKRERIGMDGPTPEQVDLVRGKRGARSEASAKRWLPVSSGSGRARRAERSEREGAAAQTDPSAE
jgi:hypothetical protein